MLDFVMAACLIYMCYKMSDSADADIKTCKKKTCGCKNQKRSLRIMGK